MSPKFMLANRRDSVGSSLAFHAQGGRGYTTNVDRAHIFSLKDAREAVCNLRSFEFFVERNKVLSNLCWKLDSQDVSKADKNKVGPFLMYRKGMWDGNDLYFLSKSGSLSTDIEMAIEFMDIDTPALENYSFLSLYDVSSLKRPTFDINLGDSLKAAL